MKLKRRIMRLLGHAPDCGGTRLSANIVTDLPSSRSSFRKGRHPLTLLVPKLHPSALEAVSNSEGYAVLKGRFGRKAGGQVVVRYPAIKVVNMVKANVAGEPLQDTGQTIVRAAVERGASEIP